MMKVCPYCNGEGKTVIVVPHPFIEKGFKTAIKWCVCMKAKFVSESPENTILSSLEGDIVLHDKINPKLVFVPEDLNHSPNLLIRGDYDTFCNHLRSVIIKYRYTEPSSSIYCCNAIDILQRFYVAQSDKTCPGLSETEKYDLLVMCLGAREKNDQLNTCVAEVTYLRMKKKKPVWIYLPYPTLELCKYEKSPELEETLKDYTPVTIVDEGVQINRPAKTTNSASNFNGI
jgi:hypothetical protein